MAQETLKEPSLSTTAVASAAGAIGLTASGLALVVLSIVEGRVLPLSIGSVVTIAAFWWWNSQRSRHEVLSSFETVARLLILGVLLSWGIVAGVDGTTSYFGFIASGIASMVLLVVLYQRVFHEQEELIRDLEPLEPQFTHATVVATRTAPIQVILRGPEDF